MPNPVNRDEKYSFGTPGSTQFDLWLPKDAAFSPSLNILQHVLQIIYIGIPPDWDCQDSFQDPFFALLPFLSYISHISYILQGLPLHTLFLLTNCLYLFCASLFFFQSSISQDSIIVPKQPGWTRALSTHGYAVYHTTAPNPLARSCRGLWKSASPIWDFNLQMILVSLYNCKFMMPIPKMVPHWLFHTSLALVINVKCSSSALLVQNCLRIGSKTSPGYTIHITPIPYPGYLQ